MLRRPVLALAVLYAATSSCRDATEPRPLAGFFVLTDVAGKPVPLAVDSTVVGDEVRLQRIYGRSLELFPGDTARYTQGVETRYRRPDGSFSPTQGSASCTSAQVFYSVQGPRIVLSLQRPQGAGPAPVGFDTLEWNGRALVQHDFVGGDVPGGSRFEYREEPRRNVCAGMFTPVAPDAG